MGALFGKKKEVKSKKHVFWTQEKREKASKREREMLNPVVGRVLEHETNPSGFQDGS
jgi:hypothetical protein